MFLKDKRKRKNYVKHTILEINFNLHCSVKLFYTTSISVYSINDTTVIISFLHRINERSLASHNISVSPSVEQQHFLSIYLKVT